MKIKWRVAPPPTGPYRSFENRDWPSAENENGNPLAYLYCRKSYSKETAKDTGEDSITVRICDWSTSRSEELKKKYGSFRSMTLVEKFKDLKSAKLAVDKLLNNNPRLLPPKETV